MSIDAQVLSDDADNLDDPSTIPSPDKRKRKTEASEVSSRHEVETKIVKRDLSANQRLIQQVSSPGHLRWISGQSRQTANLGAFNDFEDFVYDDRSLQSVLEPTAVYIIDTGFSTTHIVS
jgi:hypothetical protein